MASVLATIITSRSSQLKHIPEPLIVHPNSEITVGRGPKCGLVYADVKSISQIHCHVRNRDGSVYIKSVSSNSTLVDGKPIPKDEWIELRDGNSVGLCADPKVKIEVRIGAEVLNSASRKNKQALKNRGRAIAVITSRSDPKLEYLVLPPTNGGSDPISIAIGRSKGCHIFLDNKKISSVHCKLIFSRSPSGWALKIEAESSKNKTYLGNDQIEESRKIDSLTEPFDLCFVFPARKKPEETLTVTPLAGEDDKSEEEGEPVLTAAEMIQQELEKEAKRQKKEFRQLEKQSVVWESNYKLEIQKLQDLEHALTKEIELSEIKLRAKRGDISVVQVKVQKVEEEMNSRDLQCKAHMVTLKSDHEARFANLTNSLNETMSRLHRLNEEKLRIQMGLDTQAAPNGPAN